MASFSTYSTLPHSTAALRKCFVRCSKAGDIHGTTPRDSYGIAPTSVTFWPLQPQYSPRTLSEVERDFDFSRVVPDFDSYCYAAGSGVTSLCVAHGSSSVKRCILQPAKVFFFGS
jgi:hypothetical protein